MMQELGADVPGPSLWDNLGCAGLMDDGLSGRQEMARRQHSTLGGSGPQPLRSLCGQSSLAGFSGFLYQSLPSALPILWLLSKEIWPPLGLSLMSL